VRIGGLQPDPQLAVDERVVAEVIGGEPTGDVVVLDTRCVTDGRMPSAASGSSSSPGREGSTRVALRARARR